MMNRTASLLLAILAVTATFAAAFFKPAVPHQISAVPAESPIFARKTKAAFIDSDLDNGDIEEDGNISPARKCGFCMGVSSYRICIPYHSLLLSALSNIHRLLSTALPENNF